MAFRYLARSAAHEVRMFYISPKPPCKPVESKPPVMLFDINRLEEAGLLPAGWVRRKDRVLEEVAVAGRDAAAGARQRLLQTIDQHALKS